MKVELKKGQDVYDIKYVNNLLKEIEWLVANNRELGIKLYGEESYKEGAEFAYKIFKKSQQS